MEKPGKGSQLQHSYLPDKALHLQCILSLTHIKNGNNLCLYWGGQRAQCPWDALVLPAPGCSLPPVLQHPT